MKLIAVNGSPRKAWNTSTLLEHALKGAKSCGADTELVHLYDLSYKGCRSCFACKLVDGNSYGRCVMRDDLTSILRGIEEQCDALVLGTPIYFASMTGETRSFLERLLFAPIVYSVPAKTLFPRAMKTGVIYTMNATEEMSTQRGYATLIQATEAYLKTIFGHAESYCCYDTCQFPDYSKVVMELYDPRKKASRRDEVFPLDCRNAFDLGCRLVADRRGSAGRLLLP